MNRNPRQGEIYSNPTVIGAVTVLVTIIAVALSYNANNGLPFVRTYNLKAQVPDAAELTPGNEVRIGGKRVGVITEIKAQPTQSGTPYAQLSLKLEQGVKPLPANTTIRVRPRSPLGLKYLEVRPGHSQQGIKDGGVIPLRQSRYIVDLDQAINAFDARTRSGLQGVVHEFGNGFAGRGGDLNRALQDFNPLVKHLDPVARNFASPSTDLNGLITGLASAAGAVDPVSSQLGSLVTGAATTFDALASTDGAIAQGIAETPPTEAVAERALRRVRPVLDESAKLLHGLQPGAALLPRAGRRLAEAIEVGTPVLRRADSLADRLGSSLAALGRLVRDPAASGSLRKLTAVVRSLAPTLRYINPFQTRCNYLGLWTRNVPSTISEGDEAGTWFRAIQIQDPAQTFSTASPPADLHVNPYPHTGQSGECEAGNEKYLPGQRLGNTAAREPGATELTYPPPGVRKG